MVAFNIPKTSDLAAQFLSNLETQLNQYAPQNDKSFLRVLAGTEAPIAAGLYRMAAVAVLQTLAITATGDDLDVIGSNFGIIRKPQTSAIINVLQEASISTTIPPGTLYNGDENGQIYRSGISVVAPSGPVFAILTTLTAQTPGVAGNIQFGDPLTMSVNVPAVNGQATTVANVMSDGTDTETDDAYRVRILDEIRNVGGGANKADYRRWGTATSGVKQVYPYSGRPDIPSSIPGERTVYVEADSSLDPDGIADQTLLDAVRTNINTDPDTGEDRLPLGLVDSNLFVLSIQRQSIDVTITGLNVDSTVETSTQDAIEEALDTHFRSLSPFVEGIDVTAERNDTVTRLTISDIVEDVLKANSGYATGVEFGLVPGMTLASYLLNPGQKVKVGTVTYV